MYAEKLRKALIKLSICLVTINEQDNWKAHTTLWNDFKTWSCVQQTQGSYDSATTSSWKS